MRSRRRSLHAQISASDSLFFVTQWPAWPFTSYSPVRSELSLISGDVCFEEARCAHDASLRRGAAAAHETESQLRAAAHARASLKSQLHGASSRQLTELSGQRPLQAAMPTLSFEFGGVSNMPPMQQQHQPPPPQQMAPQPFPHQPFPPPTPFPPQPQAFPQQQSSPFPVPQMQQQQTSPFPVASQQMLPPRPAPIAPIQLGPGGVEAAWAAPAFQPGGVPETPPPPQFV